MRSRIKTSAAVSHNIVKVLLARKGYNWNCPQPHFGTWLFWSSIIYTYPLSAQMLEWVLHLPLKYGHSIAKTKFTWNYLRHFIDYFTKIWKVLRKEPVRGAYYSRGEPARFSVERNKLEITYNILVPYVHRSLFLAMPLSSTALWS